jgi:type II secretory pathway component PulM
MSALFDQLRARLEATPLSLQPLQQRWSSLDARARPIIAWSVLALFIGLVWAYLYQPMQQSRTQNAARIAAIQAQLASMRAQAEEIRSLNSVAAASPSTTTRTSADVASLTAVFGSAFTVRADVGGQYRIEAARIRYIDWLNALDNAMSRQPLKVTALNIKRLAADKDEVSVSMSVAEAK